MSIKYNKSQPGLNGTIGNVVRLLVATGQCHVTENVLTNMVKKQRSAMEYQKKLSIAFNGLNHAMKAGKSMFIKFLSRGF